MTPRLYCAVHQNLWQGRGHGLQGRSIFGDALVPVRKRIRNLKDEGWNESDLVSESPIRIRQPAVGRPHRVIRRAYQDILDREPDTAGLRLYRRRMIDDGWSEADLREALRNSREHREKS